MGTAKVYIIAFVVKEMPGSKHPKLLGIVCGGPHSRRVVVTQIFRNKSMFADLGSGRIELLDIWGMS